jgi:hypothetical protein
MEPSTKRPPILHFRSKLPWRSVVLWAALFTVVLFTPLDWSGCGFFRHGAVEFLYFFCVFSWFVIFIALRLGWRLLLLIVTAPLVFSYLGLHGVAEENAAPEAAAVGALRQFQSGLDAYRSEHQQEGYPVSLPVVTLSPYAAKFYVFKYVPARDADKRIVSYLVQATPRRRDCYLYLSFTIVDDGKVFYTFDPRAATPADKLLE